MDVTQKGQRPKGTGAHNQPPSAPIRQGGHSIFPSGHHPHKEIRVNTTEGPSVQGNRPAAKADSFTRFLQGRILFFKLRQSYRYAHLMLDDGLREATEGWRFKLRSMMRARRLAVVGAYVRLIQRLEKRDMLQPAVLMMIQRD